MILGICFPISSLLLIGNQSSPRLYETMCSLVSFLSMSLICIRNWPSKSLRNFVFVPRFPMMKSISPSLSKSAAVIPDQNPVFSSSPFSINLNFPLLFSKVLIGIQSPTTVKSWSPSLSISAQIASVNIPASRNSGAKATVLSAKCPFPSFTNRYDRGEAPYE